MQAMSFQAPKERTILARHSSAPSELGYVILRFQALPGLANLEGSFGAKTKHSLQLKEQHHRSKAKVECLMGCSCLDQIKPAFHGAGAVAVGADATDDEVIAAGVELLFAGEDGDE